MKTIAKRDRNCKWKGQPPVDRTLPVRQMGLTDQEIADLDGTVAAIQALIPLGLAAVAETLEQEVGLLAGERYQRLGCQPGCVRWSQENGSVYLGDQKLKVQYTRVRDVKANCEVPLAAYQRLQRPRGMDEGLLRRVLLGWSCGRYREAAEAVPEAFGLSRSTVSRRLIRASARKLERLMMRDLSGLDLVAVFLDGRSLAEDSVVIAVGIMPSGEKALLGFVQTATENERVVGEFLERLISRGLNPDAGLLFIIDGSKGLRAAIRTVFGETAVVQRCQWHKR